MLPQREDSVALNAVLAGRRPRSGPLAPTRYGTLFWLLLGAHRHVARLSGRVIEGVGCVGTHSQRR